MNRAAARLQALYPNVGDQTRLADEKGIDQSYMSRIFRAERTPGTTVRRLFWEEPERIPMHWWDEEVPEGHVETDESLSAESPLEPRHSPSDRPRAGSSDPNAYG